MNRKRAGLIVAGILVVLGLLWWRSGHHSAPSSKRAEAQGSSAQAQVGAVRRTNAIDPHTRPRGQISGIVVDDKDAPVAGAMVCAGGSSSRLSTEEMREPICATSKPDGSFVLANLLEARYALNASAPGFVPGQFTGEGDRHTLSLGSGEKRAGVRLVLHHGGVEVHGIVKDIGGGGVAGAVVSATAKMGWGSASAMTRSDAKGEFTLWVSKGKIEVFALADGYSSGSKSGTAPGQYIEVFLTPEAVLAGKVVEVGTKRPVVGAMVWAGSVSDGMYGGQGSARTDDRGHFRISGLEPGRYKPTANGPQLFGEAAESVLLGLGQTRDDLIIEVHPAFTISGKVVDEQGKVQDRCWVGMHDKEHKRDLSGRPDPDGSISIDGVLPGTYKPSVRCQNLLEKDEYEPVVVADKDVTGLVWTVSAGSAIDGDVVDASGTPVEDAQVSARVVGGDPRGQRSWGWDDSDSQGQFEMKGLVAGSYELEVQSADHPQPKETTKIEVKEGETAHAHLVVDTGGTIAGNVVDESGAAVSGVRVRAVGERWGSWRSYAITADDGSFEITGAPVGQLRVVAQRGWSNQLRAPGKTDDDVQGKQVKVRPGQVARVRLVVESESHGISGKVVDASGKLVTDAFVMAQRESDAAGARRSNARRSVRWGWDRQPVLTDTDGSFQLEHLTNGTYTVRAYRRGGGEAFAEGVATDSQVTLTIENTGTISGTVSLVGGGNPDEFTIGVVDRKSGFRRDEHFFRTGGRWVMRELPAGTMLVSVDAAEGTAQQTVPLGDGEEKSGVGFQLEARTTITGTAVDLDSGKPVSGMLVVVAPAKGGGSGFNFRFSRDDKKHITDDTGHFEIEDAQAGKLYVSAMPLDWGTSPYSFGRKLVTVPGGGSHDIGELRIPRRRTGPRERGGDLGFSLEEQAPDVEPGERILKVAMVRPGGPADGSGMQAGDVIVSVDGHDVTGANVFLYYSLAQVKAGTAVRFGLARGDEVSITAGKPL